MNFKYQGEQKAISLSPFICIALKGYILAGLTGLFSVYKDTMFEYFYCYFKN